MKILILGDPHGVIPKVNTKLFDAIVCTGDFIPHKTLQKIIFSSMSKGLDWQDSIPAGRLKKILKKEYASGMKVLAWLAKQHLPVFFIPGNWDMIERVDTPFYHDKLKKFKNLIDCDEKLIITDNFCIIGYGKTSGPELPINKIDALTQKYLSNEFNLQIKRLSKIFVHAKKTKKPIIFLIHNPPYNTKLDKVALRSSPAYGKHVGSQVAAKLISNFKPAFCVCGHMHENSGLIHIKKTLCINAGCLHNKKQKTYFIDMPELN